MARRRRQRRDWDKARGVILAVVGVLIIIVLGGGWYWANNKQSKLDTATNCPVSGPTAIHAVLIDRSDPINEQQAQQVRQKLERDFKEAKIGERFDLYVADGDPTKVLRAVASVCNTGRRDQANQLYQNPEMIQRQFEERFVGILRNNLDQLLVATTTKWSPILESIRAAAISSFGDVDAGTIPLRLTIISDLVQNSPLFSQITNDMPLADLLKKPEWRALQANLKGANVDLLYLRRDQRNQNNRVIQGHPHRVFWERVIDACGGRQQMFEPL